MLRFVRRQHSRASELNSPDSQVAFVSRKAACPNTLYMPPLGAWTHQTAVGVKLN
jgi:hypothetical protein